MAASCHGMPWLRRRPCLAALCTRREASVGLEMPPQRAQCSGSTTEGATWRPSIPAGSYRAGCSMHERAATRSPRPTLGASWHGGSTGVRVTARARPRCPLRAVKARCIGCAASHCLDGVPHSATQTVAVTGTSPPSLAAPSGCRQAGETACPAGLSKQDQACLMLAALKRHPVDAHCPEAHNTHTHTHTRP